MKSKRTLAIVAIVILSIVVLINILKKDLWDVNEELLKEEVLSIKDSKEMVDLSNVTPFEWDIVYSFKPYISKDTIYETIGYKWDNINKTFDEGMNQIVFLKDGKVVCHLYGYPSNTGYGINFISENNTGLTSASMLSIEDDLTFQVVRSDNVIYLKNN